jgi:hypothetical protein
VITLTKKLPPDAAYRALLGHTTRCANCNAARPCPVGDRLRNAERQARR